MTEKYDYVANERAKFFEEFEFYFKEFQMSPHTNLDILINLVITKCAQKSLDAGFSGSWGDNGARIDFEGLKKFVAGFLYARGSNVIPYREYEEMFAAYQNQNDPDYQQYLKLKERFGE